ncbi:glycosyltransferase family 2 protein [Demequina sp.]|uniref:glycosyltransferase family 2 protein n=1 Tax=Demequina sp. TaxID=2050685 RepID=UPI003D1450B2
MARKAEDKQAAANDGGSSAAALIVAHNQARYIAATVRAATAIPGIDLVLVVDDASTDNTQELARKAGAVVVRNSHARGRTASLELGAAVIGMRDEPGAVPRALLFLDGALGSFAIGAAPLVPAVTEGVCDMAIALTDMTPVSTGPTAKAARKAIELASNWKPQQPLSRIRCVSRDALEAAMPLARGCGLEVALTLDALTAGFLVTEVECDIRHKSHAHERRSLGKRTSQYRDVMLAVSARRVKGAASSTRSAVGDQMQKVTHRRSKGPDAVVEESSEVAE